VLNGKVAPSAVLVVVGVAVEIVVAGGTNEKGEAVVLETLVVVVVAGVGNENNEAAEGVTVLVAVVVAG
jgi:hypothetical protein